MVRAAPEVAIEPGLSIVNPRVHFWDHFAEQRYFVPDDAQDLYACGHNVEASAFVESRTMYRAEGPEHLKSERETEFAVGMAAMAASGKYTSSRAAAGIARFVDLTLGDRTEEALEAQIKAADGRLRGSGSCGSQIARDVGRAGQLGRLG